MHDKSITVKEVENGFEIVTMVDKEKDKESKSSHEVMYEEPKTFIAKTLEEALEMVKNKFNKAGVHDSDHKKEEEDK